MLTMVLVLKFASQIPGCGCGCWCCRRIRPPDNYIIGEAGHEGRIGGRVQCEPTIWTNAPNRATSRQAACQATLLTNFWNFLQNIGKFLLASVQVWIRCGKFPTSWSGKIFSFFARAIWVFSFTFSVPYFCLSNFNPWFLFNCSVTRFCLCFLMIQPLLTKQADSLIKKGRN